MKYIIIGILGMFATIFGLFWVSKYAPGLGGFGYFLAAFLFTLFSYLIGHNLARKLHDYYSKPA